MLSTQFDNLLQKYIETVNFCIFVVLLNW